MKRFYLDTCIWIDLIEGRVGTRGEAFGEEALKLVERIRKGKHRIVLSSEVYRELRLYFADVPAVLVSFIELCEFIIIPSSQKAEASLIADQRNVPFSDALHAIIARDSSLILVTRDKHFRKLIDITPYFFPWHADAAHA